MEEIISLTHRKALSLFSFVCIPSKQQQLIETILMNNRMNVDLTV
jgi:hypothetical protein